MHMAGKQRIDAPREIVWAALNDPDILRRCIPSCQSFLRVGDTEMCAVATATVGSVQTSFTSRMTLSALNPPGACHIAGESRGEPAGLATEGAEVRLEPIGAASTLLEDAVDAAVGGKLAQHGGRLIDQSARNMASDFFARLNDKLSGPATSPATGPATGPATERPAVAEPAAPVPEGCSAAFWLAITLVLITLVLYLMALI